DESADRVHVGVEGLGSQRDGEGAAESLLERSDAWIGEPARISAEAVVLHPARFATELDDVAAVQIGCGIAYGERRDLAAAWEAGRPTEVQPRTGNRDRGQRDRH